jgi:hypothetical protein
MKQLIKDYQNKLKNIEEILAACTNSGSYNDNEKFTRLKTKKFEYEAFITELERLEVDEKDKYTHGLYVGTRSASQTLIDIMFQVAITITSETKLRRLNNTDLTKWVREQLKASGFETSPCGASWGVLK